LSEWTTQAADTIEKTVVAVRDRTVVPAQKAAKAAIYGVVAACCVATALLLLAVGAFKALNIALPVWLSWMVLGGILIGGGVFCWTRRTGGARG
jgi:hypothetical protein